MNIFRFIFSKAFLINLIIILILFVVVIFAIFQGLAVYTRHGETITIPDVRGMVYEEVVSNFKDKHLSFSVLDSTFIPDLQPHEVVDQNPKPFAMAKEERMIYLTINTLKPPLRALPEIVSKSLDQAKFDLDRAKLAIGDEIRKPHPYENMVLRVRYKGKIVEAGDELPQGAKLDIEVGDGSTNNYVSVPYLLCLTLAETEFNIKGNSLNLGTIIYEGNITDTATAVVVKQFPESDDQTKISIGEPVDVWIKQNCDLFENNDSTSQFLPTQSGLNTSE